MKAQIQDRSDIEKLVTLFYESATEDDDIKHFFTEVVSLDFEKHIPVICDFWESILFQNAKYKGNPMVKHIVLSRKSEMTKVHFDAWLRIWHETVDDHFEGDIAVEAKQRADSIAALMQHKIKIDKGMN
jgi:hemoglobin